MSQLRRVKAAAAVAAAEDAVTAAETAPAVPLSPPELALPPEIDVLSSISAFLFVDSTVNSNIQAFQVSD